MKVVKCMSTIAMIFMVTFASFSQEKNVLIDRKFWKGKPTLKEVKQKVKEGHSPTAMTPFNFDATGYAILEHAPLNVIKYLLAQGNDVNKLTHDARTYIFWAAYKENLELMQYLIAEGASTTIIDQHGYSLLMFTAVTGQEDQAIYDYIIELGADLLEERDREGRNALLAYVGAMKNGGMLPYFIEKGLDVHSIDSDGNGAFHHAAKTGNQELVELLISEYKVSTSINEATNENAILFASTRFSRSGEETSVAFYQYLEGLGLDPLIVSKEGKTAIQNIASKSKSIELYKYFLDKGADVNQPDKDGNTALINASSRKSKELVALLTENTRDINQANKEGVNSLIKAIKYNKLEVAKYLVSQEAEITGVDRNGFDIGYHLVDGFRGNLDEFKEKMDYLISLGYDPTAPQRDGSTLLHAAVKKKNEALLAAIVDMNIDINAKDGSGQTVLHHAAMQAENDGILKYLVDAGADTGVTTEFEESAYDLAQDNEQLINNNVDVDFLKSGEE